MAALAALVNHYFDFTMTIVHFSYELAQQLFYSEDEFPVSFEDAWVWLGYSKKSHALSFLKANFVEGTDFALLRKREWSQAGRSSDIYGLTVECFQNMGMMAGTAKGKEIRVYFLQCEKELKQIKRQQSQPLMLPEQRLQIAVEGIKFFGIDVDNPRVKQGYQDYVNNLLLHQPQLASSSERWMGVAERAEELGYGRIGADHSIRTRLGKYVGQRQLERRREKRLCNGTNQNIWIYLVCNELDEVIKSYFDVHLL